jgi:DnaJ family protein A protein 5
MSQFTQSSNRPQQCLYELLGLARDCNADDIKKGYRLMARKHHPDKNGNTDEATKQFQAINNAHTVLSDPQERAWYDDHREEILYGTDSGEKGNDDINFDTSSFVSPFAYDGFSSSAGDSSFWSVYNQAFNEINRQEEIAHQRWAPSSSSKEESKGFQPRPSFGDSKTSFTDTKKFYAAWFGFTTKKTYSWVDEYDTREANGRRMRRAMEKENTKVRSAAKSKFTKSIHNLIRFVSRRDPRVKAYKEKERIEKETKEKLREREQLKKKEDRQRAMAAWKRERQLELEEQERADTQALREGRVVDRGFALADNNVGERKEDNDKEDNVSSVLEEFDCPACNKIFKSEQQWENHTKSKKHKKNVLKLKQELLAEDDSLNVDELNEAMGVERTLSKKERRKLKQQQALQQQDNEQIEGQMEGHEEEHEQEHEEEEYCTEEEEDIVVVPLKKLSKKEKRRLKEMKKKEEALNEKMAAKAKKKKKKKSKDKNRAKETEIDGEIENTESKEGDEEVGEVNVEQQVEQKMVKVKKLTKKQIRRQQMKEEREAKAIEDAAREKIRLEEEAAAAAKEAEEHGEEDGERKGEEEEEFDYKKKRQGKMKKGKVKKQRQGKNNFKKKVAQEE